MRYRRPSFAFHEPLSRHLQRAKASARRRAGRDNDGASSLNVRSANRLANQRALPRIPRLPRILDGATIDLCRTFNILNRGTAKVHHTTDELGKRLHSIRNAKGLCLRALSSQAGVSSAMICMIENGKVNPSTGVLLALARALEVAPVDLLGSGIDSNVKQQLTSTSGSDAEGEVRAPKLVLASDRKPLHKSGGVSWLPLSSRDGT